jgi:thiamine biosynthesis lipoprotein
MPRLQQTRARAGRPPGCGIALAILTVLLATGGCERLRRSPAARDEPALPAGANPDARRGARPATDLRVLTETRTGFGSVVRITLALRSEPLGQIPAEALKESRRAGEEAARLVFAELRRLEALMTLHGSDSPVVRINQAAEREPTTWVTVPVEIFNLLHRAGELGRETQGALDITYAPLEALWPLPTSPPAAAPSAAAIRQTLTRVGGRHLELDDDRTAVRLKVAGARLSLGAIGRGFALDRAAALLRQRGLGDFLLEVGSDRIAAGRHPDHPWTVDVRDPRDPALRLGALPLENRAVAVTTVDSRPGGRASRNATMILDPRSGHPVGHVASATVLAPSALLADALATAAAVLGPVKGLELLERRSDVDGVLVTPAGQILTTSRLKGKLSAPGPGPRP